MSEVAAVEVVVVVVAGVVPVAALEVVVIGPLVVVVGPLPVLVVVVGGVDDVAEVVVLPLDTVTFSSDQGARMP